MFEDIKRNKMKSWFIILLFLAFIAVIVYYICMALDLGKTSIVIAMIFAIISTWGSYYYSDRIVLSLNKARPATKEENQKLVNILDSLVVSSGLPATPKLYIVEDSQPNAFATGRNPEHAVICVTTGLLDKLEYYELEGVLAHEMSHIKNYDILLSAVVSVMVGFVVILSDWFTRITFWGGPRRSDDDDNGNPILMCIGLIPDGLISALIKISGDPNQLKVANNATENMYIVNPFRGKKSSSSLWSTHPSIEDRVEALRNIK